jgi:hypothetical protein
MTTTEKTASGYAAVSSPDTANPEFCRDHDGEDHNEDSTDGAQEDLGYFGARLLKLQTHIAKWTDHEDARDDELHEGEDEQIVDAELMQHAGPPVRHTRSRQRIS